MINIKRLTIGKRIIIGFVFIFAIFLFFLGVIALNMQTIRGIISQTNISNEIIVNLSTMDKAIGKMHAAHSEYVEGMVDYFFAIKNGETDYAANLKMEEFIKIGDDSFAQNKVIFSERLNDLLANDAYFFSKDDLTSLTGLENELRLHEELKNNLVEAYRLKDQSLFTEKMELLDASFSTISKKVENLQKGVEAKFTDSVKNSDNKINFLLQMVAILAFLGIIVGVAVVYIITKSVNFRLNSSILQMISSANSLAATAQQNSAAAQQTSSISQQVAAGANEQSKKASDISKAISSMASSVQQMSASAQEASSTAEKSSNMAQEAGQASEQSRASLETIKHIVSNTATMTKGVSGKSKKIGDIVETITGIAKQTNLLALNANIEAARAGEAGRGFAVVADEVRKLAEGSGNAASQIKALVADMISSIDETTKAAEEGTRTVEESSAVINNTIGSLQNISASVMQVSAKIQELSAGIQQQAASTQQIAKSMDSIAAISEQNSAGAQQLSATTQQQSSANQQVAAAAQQLQALSSDLMSLIRAVSEVESSHFKKIHTDKNKNNKSAQDESDEDDIEK